MTTERGGNIDLRAVFTNRLYRLKPRASRSKAASNKLWLSTHRVHCRYMMISINIHEKCM